MKIFSLLLCIFLALSNSQAKVRNDVIHVVELDAILDKKIKNEVERILEKKVRADFNEFSRKKTKSQSLNIFTYKSWSFHFELQKVNEQNLKIINKQIVDLRFYHVKYMLQITSASFVEINKIIDKYFGEKKANKDLTAYQTRDNLRNYLCYELKDKNLSLQFIFIFQNSEFYNCVVKRKRYEQE